MVYVLIACPLALAAMAFAMPSNRWRPWLLPIGALINLYLVMTAVFRTATAGELFAASGWLALDPLGKIILGFVSLLFCLASLYAPGYLALYPTRRNRLFCANLFIMLAMMTLVALSHHLGLMWVAMEATTLASAPLLYFGSSTRALEATWKYLVVCSVGIALALLGTFFLAYSSLKAGEPSTLLFDELVKIGPRLSGPWLHAAFVLLFVGYGTKLGLAPMHTWKPDAYGEAPGLVGTLLAGGLTSSALLAILRIYQVCRAGPEAATAREILIGMGLFSMAVAAAFMIRQRDFKRLLAYSSVEHMGILVLGIGIGGAAIYGALLHIINNGLTKGVLFLSAGNIQRAYGSKRTEFVQGAMRRLPVSGALFLAGFLAITGSPPFGPFVSEFTIIRAALAEGHSVAGGLSLLIMGVVFVGMGATVLAVVGGNAPGEKMPTQVRDTVGTAGPIVLLMAVVLLLGVYIPAPLDSLLREAQGLLEARR